MQMDSANTVCKDASVICPVTFSLPALRSTTRLQEAKQNPQFPGGTLAELCDCCLWFNQHSSLTAGDPSFVVCVLQAHTFQLHFVFAALNFLSQPLASFWFMARALSPSAEAPCTCLSTPCVWPELRVRLCKASITSSWVSQTIRLPAYSLQPINIYDGGQQ